MHGRISPPSLSFPWPWRIKITMWNSLFFGNVQSTHIYVSGTGSLNLCFISWTITQRGRPWNNRELYLYLNLLFPFFFLQLCVYISVYTVGHLLFWKEDEKDKKIPLLLQHLLKSCMLILRNCTLKLRSRISVQDIWRTCVKDCLTASTCFRKTALTLNMARSNSLLGEQKLIFNLLQWLSRLLTFSPS